MTERNEKHANEAELDNAGLETVQGGVAPQPAIPSSRPGKLPILRDPPIVLTPWKPEPKPFTQWDKFRRLIDVIRT